MLYFICQQTAHQVPPFPSSCYCFYLLWVFGPFETRGRGPAPWVIMVPTEKGEYSLAVAGEEVQREVKFRRKALDQFAYFRLRKSPL